MNFRTLRRKKSLTTQIKKRQKLKMRQKCVKPSGQINEIDDGSFGHFFSCVVFALLDEGDADDRVSPRRRRVHVRARDGPEKF